MTEVLAITTARLNQFLVTFACDKCGCQSTQQMSDYSKKKRHFCSRGCYSDFRREGLPMNEQHAYKGVRKEGESKQVYHRRYCETHPETISHLKARRYAREKGAEGSHTLEEWKELCDAYQNKCAICREAKPLTKDHIVPLSKGGHDYIGNIQPLCRNCNSKKHNHIHENPELLEDKDNE